MSKWRAYKRQGDSIHVYMEWSCALIEMTLSQMTKEERDDMIIVGGPLSSQEAPHAR